MIGVLDSGVGGLSIYKEIKKRYPDKQVIYLADKKNFPYGEHSEGELYILVRNAIEKLLKYGVDIIVVACNSATITTISRLRDELDIPIVGIEPAVKQADSNTKNKKIGVLATTITTKDHDSEKLAPEAKLYKHHDTKLVSKIENDFNEITDSDLEKVLEPMIAKGVDSIVLGCTHYHFLKERMEGLYPEIHFYAPEEAVVNRLETVIDEKNVELTRGNDIFLCSAKANEFGRSLYKLLGIVDADIRKI